MGSPRLSYFARLPFCVTTAWLPSHVTIAWLQSHVTKERDNKNHEIKCHSWTTRNEDLFTSDYESSVQFGFHRLLGRPS